MPRSRRLALVALLAASLTACGSTVQLSSTRTVEGDGTSVDQTTGGTTGAAGSTGSSTSGTTGVVTTGGSPGTSGTTGTSGATGAGSSGSTGTTGPSGSTTGGTTGVARGAVPAKGRGWDAKTVYIGVVTQNDAQKAFATVGANVDPGDTTAQTNAMVAAINKRGGILGRQVKIRFKDVATIATATNPTAAGSAVCTYFTQDAPVIAVVSIVTLMDYPNFRSCLARKQVPLFSATVKTVDDVAAKALAPFYYQTIAASWSSVAPVLVARLKAQGYFSGWNAQLGAPGSGTAKVGVLVDGTDIGGRVGKLLKDLLTRAGYQTFVYQYADATEGQSKSVSYFSGNRVTHVIVTDVELTAFQSSASSQNYKPRFGVTTYNDPYSNLENSGLTPPSANNGALGIGWAPNFDVSPANDPHRSPGAAACDKAMSASGQSFAGKRLAQAIAYSMCDSMNLIADGANKGNGFSGPAIAAGIVASRSTFAVANGFTAALTSSKHFVSGTARDLAWVSSCSCFRYGAAVTPL